MKHLKPKIAVLTIFLSISCLVCAQETYKFSDAEYREVRKLSNGRYGYNPYISIQENKKHYAEMGYTISYKMKDTTIYMIAGAAILFTGLIAFVFDSYQKGRHKK